MRLRLGSVENLPFDDKECFDKIYTVNTYMSWKDPAVSLMNLYPLLKPNGRIAITHQPKKPGATENDTLDAEKEISQALNEAGFKKVEAKLKNIRPVAAVCVLAEK